MLLSAWKGVWNSGWADRTPGLPTANPFGLPRRFRAGGPCAFGRWRCSGGPRSRPSARVPRPCWPITSGSSEVSPKGPK